MMITTTMMARMVAAIMGRDEGEADADEVEGERGEGFLRIGR